MPPPSKRQRVAKSACKPSTSVSVNTPITIPQHPISKSTVKSKARQPLQTARQHVVPEPPAVIPANRKTWAQSKQQAVTNARLKQNPTLELVEQMVQDLNSNTKTLQAQIQEKGICFLPWFLF